MNRRLFDCKNIRLAFYGLLFVMFLSPIVDAKQHSVAIFQFTATSMDVVGIENDVAYVVRNELRKNSQLSLLNQREMEVVLMRNGIIQGFDLEQAINAGQSLDVNFVIMGKVSRVNGNIVSQIALVSSANRQMIASWNFNFINQQDVLNRSNEIGSKIAAEIDQFIATGSGLGEDGSQTNWLSSIDAKVLEGQSRIVWSVGEFAPQSLGFNIYRGLSDQGPFSYLSSVLDAEYVDDISDIEGDVFYQVSLLTETGEELRSKKIAGIKVTAQVVSSLAPPAVLNVNQLIRGIEITFLPSAQNVTQQVIGYQLVRREKGQPWKVVNTVSRATLSTSNKKSEANSDIKQYTLVDAEAGSIVAPVEYAVRAINGQELGQTSDLIGHVPVQPPTLLDTGTYGLRQSLVKWQPVEAGQGYNVYRRDALALKEWVLISTINDLTQTSYIDKDFSAENQSFQYAVNVFDQYSVSALSQAITLTSRGPLRAPENFTIESGLAQKVILRWQAYQDQALKGYAIFRTPFTEQVEVTLEKVAEVLDPNAQQYIDESVTLNGTSYYYAVAALNSFNTSGDLSPVQQGTTKEAPLPVDRLLFDIQQSQINLSWSLNQQASANIRFKLERRWQQTQWQSLATLDGGTLSYIDKQLMPQAEVEYRVSVVDEDSLVSAPISSELIQTLNNIVMLPQADGLMRINKLVWQAVPVAEKIRVLRREKNQPWQTIAELDGVIDYYDDTNQLADDTYYEYSLAIVYAGQIVSQSEPLSMKTKDIPAPGELNIINGKPRELVLNWSHKNDPDIKSYLVYRATESDDYEAYNFVAEIPSSQTSSFTDSVEKDGIEHGKIYRYAVASRNIFDAIGPISPGVEGFTKKLPGAASEISAQAESSMITLNWQTGSESDLQLAEVYRRWQHEKQWTVIDKINANSNTYQDSQLLPYASAEYKIKLVDEDGLSSADSDIVRVTSPLVTELAATEQGLLRKSVINWTPNPLVGSYKILRSENNLTWQEMATVNGSEYVDEKNMIDEKTYFYQLTIIHQGQQIGQSNAIEVVTKALPQAPQNIQVKSGQVKKVTLTWTPYTDSDIGGYIVYRLKDNGKLDELEKLKLSASEYIDEGSFFSKLEHNSEYQYLISSFNRFKVEGPKSQPITATTKPLPKAVAGLRASVEQNVAKLTWQANNETDISQYIVYRGKSCGRASQLTTLSATLTEYTDTTVERGNDYCYYLIAKDADSLESETYQSVSLNLPATESAP